MTSRDFLVTMHFFSFCINDINSVYYFMHLISGHRYLIKDQKYWQYDDGENNVAPGYPKMFAFLDCH